jgi:hypothetical protein
MAARTAYLDTRIWRNVLKNSLPSLPSVLHGLMLVQLHVKHSQLLLLLLLLLDYINNDYNYINNYYSYVCAPVEASCFHLI